MVLLGSGLYSEVVLILRWSQKCALVFYIVHVVSRLERREGHFGMARVYYEILDNSTGQRLPSGQDFASAVSYVEVGDRQGEGTLFVSPLADGLPEFAEAFTIRLLNVTGRSQGCTLFWLHLIEGKYLYTSYSNMLLGQITGLHVMVGNL